MTVVILKISLKKSREFEKEFKKFAKKKNKKKTNNYFWKIILLDNTNKILFISEGSWLKLF